MVSRITQLLRSRADVRTTLALLALLLAVSTVSPDAYRFRPNEDTTIKKVLRTLRKRGLNREAEARQTAGYYEGLLDEAAVVTQMGGHSLLDWRHWFVERTQHSDRRQQFIRNRPDFLRVELRPNVDVPDVDERRRTVTNSFGMMDVEYPLERMPRTWRIALIGDSVSQGVGAAFGANYEARLEEHLNRNAGSGPHSRYEILNFSVRGYQLTHFVEVARTRVPAFSPDLYVVALTERSVFTKWADHLATLVRAGVDLKYDYLQRLVKDAQLQPNMSAALINARLAPYRTAVFRWAMTEIQDQARRDNVPFVVLLVPTANDPETQIVQFEPVRRVLADLSIPTIDLLDTFAYMDDRSTIEVRKADKHPNDEGHRMLFDVLVRRLDASSEIRHTFTGTGRAAKGPGTRPN
jgi:hypothetical protein